MQLSGVLALLSSTVLLCTADPLIPNPADYVLPFIGTTNGGHVFPGATLPHGMVKAGLDTNSPGNQAGYDADPQYDAIGFSQLHDSGTGGSASLSNFKIWPFASCPSFTECPTSPTSRAVPRKLLSDGSPDDAASPGYFASNLSTDIRAELTTTRRTALHRYTFPSSSAEPRLVVDLTDDGLQSGYDVTLLIDPTTARVTGDAWFEDFKGENYEIGSPSEYGSCGSSGALLTFQPATNGTTSILVRVGVSFISSAQACSNAEEEISDWDFERVHSDALAQWNELLGRVQVDPTGVEEEKIQLFYSSLYRTHIVPADYTGENPRWQSSEPYYDSYYCWLPECRGATIQQWVQGGSNADPILGEFFVKYNDHAAALNVSISDLYSSLLTDSQNEPGDWDLQGRQAVAWDNLNYVPDEFDSDFGGTNTRQVSRTLEYAFGDFAISQVAKLIGNDADAAKFAKRSNGAFNMWNPNVTLPGFPGVIDGNNHDGFYESSPMVYSQFVPHDTAQLITLQGGNESFIERLNIIFNQSYFDPTDEPSQQIPFMYHYANRPGLTTKQTRQVISESYNTSVSGLPGNDDSG
ncbi:hypothetical protein HHX47_DHR1001504 [Lentinula edodes]|nr:hypothetical protein HHX47_DHR1001504 [Lentinula edodes]